MLLSLASCHKEEPAPTNDFLGHWQADKVAYTLTTPSSVVLNTFTTSYAQTLDVTASTITYTHPTIVGGTVAVPVSFTYTRSGEDLTITSGTWLASKRTCGASPPQAASTKGRRRARAVALPLCACPINIKLGG